MKKNLLVTGVSGLLGSNLAYVLKDKYRILGLYHAHEVMIKGVQAQKADILSPDSVRSALVSFDPDAVIHCAANADVDDCEDHRDLAAEVNIIGTKTIVDCLKDCRAKLIYISTDSVYDGIKGHFSENDSVDPPNYYGITKHKGEQEALKHGNALIARTNFIGWNVGDKLNLAEWVMDALLGKKQINGFTDIQFSPIYTFELAKLLDQAIAKDLKGVYNFAGCGSLTKYEFACLLAKKFNLDSSLIKPISVEEHAFKARRGKNLSLNTNKLARDLGVLIPTVEESIDLFVKDYNNGILQELKSTNRLAKRRR
ncbi:MAG TPA: SDR family oxidoreductase [Candidatus Omnitrophota bacterium]|nr:SDR family oxidoreductase [Candidatus Omnitrophota bacterium]HPD84110.1 SDR family oxidoreductase [Candidatus Omnitrophota bacterium]